MTARDARIDDALLRRAWQLQMEREARRPDDATVERIGDQIELRAGAPAYR